MFDCVMPTRNGRNGMLFTAEGVINIRNKKWEDDFSPIDPDGTAFVDTLYSKAYLHHLATCGEMLAAQIASLHNIAFYLRLVGEARNHILAGDFKAWKETMVQKTHKKALTDENCSPGFKILDRYILGKFPQPTSSPLR